MRDIDDVIDVYHKRWVDDPTPERHKLYQMMINIKRCWFDVHIVAGDDDEYPEVIHTHGLLYHFDREIEVKLTPFHPKLRMAMAKKVVTILNEALHGGSDPYEAIMNNRFFTARKIEDRIEEDDGLLIYDDEPYHTAVYEPIAWN